MERQHYGHPGANMTIASGHTGMEGKRRLTGSPNFRRRGPPGREIPGLAEMTIICDGIAALPARKGLSQESRFYAH